MPARSEDVIRAVGKKFGSQGSLKHFDRGLGDGALSQRLAAFAPSAESIPTAMPETYRRRFDVTGRPFLTMKDSEPLADVARIGLVGT